MLNIRRGTFETNSSSTHAMIIASDPVAPGMAVYFGIGEYGWDHDKLTYPDEKASYLYTGACDYYGRDMRGEIRGLLEPYGVQCLFGHPRFKTFDDGSQYLDNGYVDHCSELQEFLEAVLTDPDRLIRYLFSDDSFVVLTNDNCDDDLIDEAESVTYPHEFYYKGN